MNSACLSQKLGTSLVFLLLSRQFQWHCSPASCHHAGGADALEKNERLPHSIWREDVYSISDSCPRRAGPLGQAAASQLPGLNQEWVRLVVAPKAGQSQAGVSTSGPIKRTRAPLWQPGLSTIWRNDNSRLGQTGGRRDLLQDAIRRMREHSKSCSLQR